MLHLGIDLGSKTVKLVVLDDDGELIDSSYERHLSNVPETLSYRVHMLARKFPNERFSVGVTGSAGMQFAQVCSLHSEQEVISARAALERYAPETDVAIEIGGEDSKVLFLTDGEELRMNNTCAGGTGSFIDNIAGMLDLKAADLNYYAYGATHIYPIASRCAVFAQSDVRPLVNEGVSKADIAASTFNAVVTQCVSGLACGRRITGHVAFLGGPLHFLSYLRKVFCDRLEIAEDDCIVPEDAHLFVAKGAALLGWDTEPVSLEALEKIILGVKWDVGESLERLEPLFDSLEEYRSFSLRHMSVAAKRVSLGSYEGDAYLGVDSGSEAIKYVLVGKNGEFLRGYYKRSAGDVVEAAREMLVDLWNSIPRYIDGTPQVRVAHATVIGYGEDYLRQAFSFDSGEVETVAHVWAARELVPDVDFLLDIGGQDIKCVYLDGGQIENVVLNEACSSGCGALLSGMAWSMNIDLKDFVERALFAKSPVDLGTRCTVFMTSRVRHAQKEGVDVGDISAGLAYSVVRNAIQKVIRVSNPEHLGKKIVVQGGTFANDAVLRAFEKYYGVEVIRPFGSETMGAYGAALLARERAIPGVYSKLLNLQQVQSLVFQQTDRVCELCPNACHLTVTSFSDSDGEQRSFSVGNKCMRGSEDTGHEKLSNMFDLKLKLLFGRKSIPREQASRGEIGLIRALGVYEIYPFLLEFFNVLGYHVLLSDPSSEELYASGIEAIPSESMCFPGKLVFGHAQNLIDKGVKTIFAPYILGLRADNDSCPVLASYPLALLINIAGISDGDVDLISPVLSGLFVEDNREAIVTGLQNALMATENPPDRAEIEKAFSAGLEAQLRYQEEVRELGARLLASSRSSGGRAVVLAGRPYHLDPFLHHNIPEMLRSNGLTVLTEDALDLKEDSVSNWDYSNRVAETARATTLEKKLEFVELLSFNCGPDALVVDRVQDIMSEADKPYAVLKIDEMVDVSSARIRIRSMLAAGDQVAKKTSGSKLS